MRNILFFIILVYIGIVINMIGSSIENLGNTVKSRNTNQIYKLPNDVKREFNKVINR